MKLFHENEIFGTVKVELIKSLFETARLNISVSISPRNLYYSLKSIKEIQSNFNGLNTFGTMIICSRQG